MTAIAWRHYGTGNYRICCPVCGRGERDKTLGLTVDESGAGVAHCFRCAFTESYRAARGAHLPMPSKPRIKATVPSAKHDTLSDYGHDLWNACRAVSGDALAYLSARRCRIPPADGDLRWHPSLKHPADYAGPALVGLVTHAVTREPMTLHKTWIRTDGRKADVAPPRLLLGGHRKAGGVIRLWPDEAVTSGLGVAEGVETALSLAHGYAPVWACIDAGNLKALPVLAGIESLTVAADDDPAGKAAAAACAQRWSNAGREVVEVSYGA
ncbi:DUF7146 domain-containing protein [Burkholderia pseudomallei]|uniref:DUF7146 domain-containing protein n=1 Tax=Burkholderia pseudomallei TaxID=28450 RepID=UPI000F046A54|nr:toprim domain-containing protein [Burkholderia pseudomallei]CAJ3219926.1 virulence-associated protein E [Burkholderia pseudomallei]CAJ3307423.1 virulence-associated protein E [Burkholderia pseudomallei]CAJ3916804.1 virulence-associated protein E [Burkholderia pseudomallei]CAJ5033139.1 virulence-associated protein E [Burkholderia pseudomallei]CAJ7432725.1 virulence-associated protein E [Burkholderia pseudomallei]